jgi:hypothetical protein
VDSEPSRSKTNCIAKEEISLNVKAYTLPAKKLPTQKADFPITILASLLILVYLTEQNIFPKVRATWKLERSEGLLDLNGVVTGRLLKIAHTFSSGLNGRKISQKKKCWQSFGGERVRCPQSLFIPEQMRA